MDRLYQANAGAAAPAAAPAASRGYPTEGDPANAVLATILGPYWFHMVTEALVTVIEDANLAPDHADPEQFRNALRALIAAGGAELATNAEHTQANPPGDKAATPSGVRAVRDALLGGAPAALDTLNELAAALGDDHNYAAATTALITALAGRVTALEDGMTEQTKIYVNDAGLEITDAGVVVATNDDLSNYDAIFLLFRHGARPYRSHPAWVASIGNAQDTEVVMESIGSPDSPRDFVAVHSTGARNLTMRAKHGVGANQDLHVNAVIGVTFG